MRRWNTVLCRTLAVFVAAWVLGGWVLAQEAEDDPVTARTFQVRYRPLADAADVVSAVLSEDGSLTLKLRLNVLVVEDRRSVLDRVEDVLESFDLPPRDVEVTFTLILGVDVREDDDRRPSSGSPLTEEVRGVLETLGDITKWHSYEPLGSRSVTGVEGREVRARLTDDYRVVFTVGFVHERRGLVDFKRVVLQRMRRDDEGREISEDLYAVAGPVKMDRLHLLGAASGPHAKRALFLAVQVRER